MSDSNRALNRPVAPYWTPLKSEGAGDMSRNLSNAESGPVPGPYIPPAMRGASRPSRLSGSMPVVALDAFAREAYGGVMPLSPSVSREPEPVEAETADDSPSVDLPWIDTFLEIDDAALPSASVAPEETPLRQATVDEVWPLDEAGREMTEIAHELSAHDMKDGAASNHPDVAAEAEREEPRSDATGDIAPAPFTSVYQDVSNPPSGLPALPMWNDEEWMDIMPMSPAKAASDAADARPVERPWADLAREEAARRGEVEAAAQALEALAHRVRSGDLPLPGYQAALGDAAALAAALAALLGVRR